MAGSEDPEKRVIVYYDDSTGEISTERDGHFHFTDLSGGHFREHQHGDNHQHEDQQQHRGKGNRSASSSAGRRRGTHCESPAAATELLDEGFLNKLLSAGISIPIDAYRAHQDAVRRQQQFQPQQGHQEQRRWQPEKQLKNQTGGGNPRSTWKRLEEKEESSSQPLVVPVRVGFDATQDDASSRNALPAFPGTFAADNAEGAKAVDRSPGEVKFFDKLREEFAKCQQNSRPASADSASQRRKLKPQLPADWSGQVEGSTSQRRRLGAKFHPARLVSTPQGLVIHFDPCQESDSEGQSGAGGSRTNRRLANREDEAGAQGAQEVDLEAQGGNEREHYRRLLTRVGELSRIRAFVEQEEARLVARLNEHDVEVYGRHRRAELAARIRWAVDEQNRLTREAEELMTIADEKYDRVARVGELATAAERSLDTLSTAFGGKVARREGIARTGAGAVDRLHRDIRSARNPDADLTDDRLDQYEARKSDDLVRSRPSDYDDSASFRRTFLSGAPHDARGVTAPSLNRCAVRGNNIDQRRDWKPSHSTVGFRASRSSGFRSQTQFDEDEDVDFGSRQKQGFHGADDGESESRARIQHSSDARVQQRRDPSRQREEFRGIENLINRKCAAAREQVGDLASQVDIERSLEVVNNGHRGGTASFGSRRPQVWSCQRTADLRPSQSASPAKALRIEI